ncbi:hypothetical protein S83_029179, partial [Arachis hypogaea]
AIVAPIAAASDDGAVAESCVTVVLAPVADEAHPFLLPCFCIVDEEILVLFLVNIHASSMYGKLNIDRIHFLIKARKEEQIQATHDEV